MYRESIGQAQSVRGGVWPLSECVLLARASVSYVRIHDAESSDGVNLHDADVSGGVKLHDAESSDVYSNEIHGRALLPSRQGTLRGDRKSGRSCDRPLNLETSCRLERPLCG